MTDRRLIDDLNRVITHPARAREPLPPAAGQAAIPGRGEGKPTAGGSGSGIASPLTEQPARTIEVIKTIDITGGDAQIDLAQMVDVTFIDAEGREVRMILKPDDRPLPTPSPVP